MKSIFRFIANPVVGGVISIVSLALAIYFYYDGVRAPQLTYHVHPVRAAIVKAGTEGLKVSYSGTDVQGDISAVQVAIWNAGKQPIAASDVLTPIQLTIEGGAPVLEATIRKMSRPVTQIKIDETGFKNGVIGLSWKILEKDDGCVMQVIYAGDVEKNLNTRGDVVGQRGIAELKYSGSIASPAEQYVKSAKEHRALALGLFISCVIMVVSGPLSTFVSDNVTLKNKAAAEALAALYRTRAGKFAIIVISLGYLIGAVYLWLRSRVPSPPFGF